MEGNFDGFEVENAQPGSFLQLLEYEVIIFKLNIFWKLIIKYFHNTKTNGVTS